MKGYQAYRKTSVQTADRTKVIVMLYEKAISHLNRARLELDEGIEGNEWTTRVNKALEIIKHLSNALDFEKGGEIAGNLSALYDYIRDIINEGNITRNTKFFLEAANLLSCLLEAWRKISDEQSGAQPAPSQQSPASVKQEYSPVEPEGELDEPVGARRLSELIA